MKPYPLVAATGMLGSGYRPESLDKAIALGARMIGCDAGSNDGGPAALATGKPKFSRMAVRRDTEAILTRAVAAKLPVVIGSSGTAGGDANLAWMVDIVREIARERGLHFNLGVVHSEISRETLRQHFRDGRTRPLNPSAPLTEQDIDDTVHAVGMMGAEPIQEAYQQGAQIIVAGRSSDTSIYASLPLLEGAPPAMTWHAAKILECGAAAVTQRLAPDSMMAVIANDYFDIFPLRDDFRCSPQSVASHTLYENADPFELVEPSGVLFTTDSTYEQISDQAVRVRGSRFEHAPEYTIKLEGARLRGYSTILMGGIRDPIILRQIDSWLASLEKAARIRIAAMTDAPYTLITRVYGRDGVMGPLEPTPTVDGHEAMVLWEVVAGTQDLAHSIISSFGHLALHNPVPEYNGLITTIAYPVTPAEIDRGPIYEWNLHHVVVPDTPTSLFPIEIERL